MIKIICQHTDYIDGFKMGIKIWNKMYMYKKASQMFLFTETIDKRFCFNVELCLN